MNCHRCQNPVEERTHSVLGDLCRECLPGATLRASSLLNALELYKKEYGHEPGYVEEFGQWVLENL